MKPTTTALLCGPALAGTEPVLVAIACLATGTVALVAHGIRYGARVAYRMPDAPRGASWVTALEAAGAVGILLPLRFQPAVLPVAGAVLLLLLVAGPPGVRAFSFGLAAQQARVRAFLGANGWARMGGLPAALRRHVSATPLGATPPRATRAGLARVTGFPRLRLGWLVQGPDADRIVGRGRSGRARALELAGPREVTLVPGTWADLIRIDTEGQELRILLLKDGPAPTLVVRGLSGEPAREDRVPTQG